MSTPVEVHKPGHPSHGMRGHVVGRAGALWVVDVDGVEAGFEQGELLFLKFRRAPEPLIDYWLRNFFWFAIGTVFGVMVAAFQSAEPDGGDGLDESERALHEGDPQ